MLTTALLAAAGMSITASAQNSEDLLSKAIDLENHGVLMEASSVYERYLKQEPKDTATRKRLVELLLKLNKMPQALPILTVSEKSCRKIPMFRTMLN